jgi:hypothetical protein
MSVDVIVGPKWDRRVIDLEIPKSAKSIGLMVSGGLDSAILLYALHKVNPGVNIQSYCVPRLADDAKTHSYAVHKKVGKLLGKDIPMPTLIGTANDENSVSATRQLLNEGKHDYIYDGVNHQPPLGFGFYDDNPKMTTTENRGSDKGYRAWRIDVDGLITPFLHTYKYHLIDLYYKFDVEELIEPTHSCTTLTEGRCNECNWCWERAWAFEQLELTDPGTN